MTDKIIDFSKSEQYSLSIRLLSDGFSFYVRSETDTTVSYNKKICFTDDGDYDEQLKKYIYEEEHLLLPYKKVYIIDDVTSVRLIPEAYYDRDYLCTLFYAGLPADPTKKLIHNHLRKSNYHLIFEYDLNRFSFLTRTFGINRVYSHLSPLIEYFCKKYDSSEKNKLYIHINQNRLDVIAFKKNELHHLNSFSITQTSDFLYYILTLWETLQFDQEKDEIIYSGETPIIDELIPLLKRYIRTVSSLSKPMDLALKEDQRVPLEILTLTLCE
ncbi:MAG: DUF3822 family protein [Bacteroidales bacterium]